MTTDERQALRTFIRDGYSRNREAMFVRKAFCPATLDDEQVDGCISIYGEAARGMLKGGKDYLWCADELFQRMRRPVGFSPLVWLMIGKLIIELILLFWMSTEEPAG